MFCKSTCHGNLKVPSAEAGETLKGWSLCGDLQPQTWAVAFGANFFGWNAFVRRTGFRVTIVTSSPSPDLPVVFTKGLNCPALRLFPKPSFSFDISTQLFKVIQSCPFLQTFLNLRHFLLEGNNCSASCLIFLWVKVLKNLGPLTISCPVLSFYRKIFCDLSHYQYAKI